MLVFLDFLSFYLHIFFGVSLFKFRLGLLLSLFLFFMKFVYSVYHASYFFWYLKFIRSLYDAYF